MSHPLGAPEGPEIQTLGALVHQLSHQIPDLVRSEIRLAQAEVAQKGKRAGVGIGMFIVAGLLGFFGIAALVVGVLAALGASGPDWMEWLLFTVFSVAGISFFRRTLMRRFNLDQGTQVDNLVGETAIPLEEIPPGGVGKAEMRGSAWSARNAGAVKLSPGQRCRVERIEGLSLWLRPE